MIQKDNKKLKSKLTYYEKMIELLIDFFRKIGDVNFTNESSNFSPQNFISNSMNSHPDEGLNKETFTFNILKQKLIELEKIIKFQSIRKDIDLNNDISSESKKMSLGQSLEEINFSNHIVNSLSQENKFPK